MRRSDILRLLAQTHGWVMTDGLLDNIIELYVEGDKSHKEIIDEFMNDKELKIPELKREKKEIGLKIKNANLSLDARLELNDKLIVIKQDITAELIL